MKAIQKGFTLIELMVAVSIVALMAAIALPAYLDRSTKAKVSEGLIVMDAIKLRITEVLGSDGVVAPDMLTGVVETDNLGRYIDKAGINLADTTEGAGAAVWVRYNANVAPANKKCLNLVPQVLNPDSGNMEDIVFVDGSGQPTPIYLATTFTQGVGNINWACRTTLINGILSRYLPHECARHGTEHTICPQN